MIPSSLVLVVSAMLLTAWGRWLDAKPSARWVRFVGPLALIGTIAGIAFTIRALHAAFGAMEHVDPSERAHRLAAAIASAMTGVAAAIALQILAAMVLTVATWRYHWRAKAPEHGSGLPYR